jgi:Predicted flavoproteins
MQFKKQSVAIIGAGPAGCMCAYFALKKSNVTLFDFSEPLHTLLYTGGGRCNLAYAEYDFKELTKFYPRGEKIFIFNLFKVFNY